MKMRLLACVGLAVAAGAQGQTTYEFSGAQLRFEVFDPGAMTWGASVQATSGQQVEWRAVVSYTGTRTDLFAMGEVLYQPTISNADNTGTGAEADQIGAWRNGGNGANSVPGSMLTQPEGDDGGVLSSYGRVRFGGTACTATGSNTMTSFRHSDGSGNAPTGSWIRIAGSYVSQWPAQYVNVWPGTDGINRILRGISSQQQSQSLSPLWHIPTTQNVVIFRQTLVLSDDPGDRMVQISTFNEALRRVGGPSSTDDTRYMTWQTGPADSGSHRTGVTIVPATIWVNVPSPGIAVVMGVGWLAGIPGRRQPR